MRRIHLVVDATASRNRGRVMAKLPNPVPFLLFPFETLWTRARAETLNVGDPAPDFSLADG